MCFYLFSPQGKISTSFSERIVLHPDYYRRDPRGKSYVHTYIEIEAKTDGIESIILIYPNRTETHNIQDSNCHMTRTFDNLSVLQILDHFDFEIYTISLDESLQKGDKWNCNLSFVSPNAFNVDGDLSSVSIDFDVSGPGSVRRSFLQALEGIEESFEKIRGESTDSVEKSSYTKLIRGSKEIDKHLIKKLKSNPTEISYVDIEFLLDPVLRGVDISEETNKLNDTTEFGKPPDFKKWPYTNNIKDMFFGSEFPYYQSYTLSNPNLKAEKCKFKISGEAFRNLPTTLVLQTLAFITALSALLLQLL